MLFLKIISLRYLLLCFVALVVVWGTPVQAADLATASQRGGKPDAAWRQGPIWDDGNAEFSAYEVTWSRYRDEYKGSALLILVKEPWAPDLDVKADRPRPQGFDVLKLNHVRDVKTGIYTYHQMASVYFERDSAALVKVASTSSEACGISTALMRNGQLTTHSYFDGQGDETHAYPVKAVPQDGLHALLRDFVQGTPPKEIDVFPSLMTGHFAGFAAERYRVSKKIVADVQVPAGTYEGVEIELVKGSSKMRFIFDQESPHLLLKLVHSNGTEYKLAKTERIPYWSNHQPGDESWYPEQLQ